MGDAARVGAFKTVSSKKISPMRGTPAAMVWQRNYYERHNGRFANRPYAAQRGRQG
jgi:hypothetical protein